MNFTLIKKDRDTDGRLGIIKTPHGDIKTPAFMPVGTQGTVKALTPDELSSLGVEMILGNTYHLYLRPGHEIIKGLGGLHRFMNWDGPILTDSGGYQIYSLNVLRELKEEGACFKSHLDGSMHLLTPEKAVEIQEALGADIAMALDECTPYPVTHEKARVSMELTTRWARRCKDARKREGQALFGIIQGGVFNDLRVESVQQLTEIGFDGYAIGGLSVGEGIENMCRVLEDTVPFIPEDKTRYLMGVGMPEDIMEGVKRGIDIFDCVLPTRNARNGMLFTDSGKIVIKNSRYTDDPLPIDEKCGCYTCRSFSRAYLRHLYMAGEILSSRLNAIHNIYYYMSLMANIREAIKKDRLSVFRKEFYEKRGTSIKGGEGIVF
ncbi:MAG: tRNA guanosine(34) transglycosylase Tgt [Thermodesulfobacteriota bacterium]